MKHNTGVRYASYKSPDALVSEYAQMSEIALDSGLVSKSLKHGKLVQVILQEENRIWGSCLDCLGDVQPSVYPRSPWLSGFIWRAGGFRCMNSSSLSVINEV